MRRRENNRLLYEMVSLRIIFWRYETMIVLNIKCKNPEEMAKFRDRMCEALVGSPAFKNNEIAVCDFTDLDKAFSIFIGNSNDHDVEYDLIDKDFMER
jgi:hypothetical protein